MPKRRLRQPTIYEVYPRSFRDTTGTGEGDLNGVIEGLDHIASLGVDAIWLAPIYPSPMVDGGYDVSDHRAVDPRFGDLNDFDRLVDEADKRGMGIIMDMVLNHTSEAHPWFQEALAGCDHHAAHYVFRDPKPDGQPPNNWMSFFGGSAWRWCPQRDQYYFHQYHHRQPALDMRCPDVQEQHRDTLAFWKDRGVAGFRFDTVTAYLHDPDLRDNPPAQGSVRGCVEGPPNSPYARQDHLHDLLPGDCASFMENVRDWAGEDMWLLGECTSGNQALKLIDMFTEHGRLDALYTTRIPEQGAAPDIYRDILNAFGGSSRTPWWFGCHDQPRTSTALGDGSSDAARFYIALLAVLPGPIILYQGEELGLAQPNLTHAQTSDIFDLRFWPDGPGRDGARVPIPWTSDNGQGQYGFTMGTPWKPMAWPSGTSIEEQTARSDSVLAFAKKALSMRRSLGWADPGPIDVSVSEDVLEVRTPKHSALFNFANAGRSIPPVTGTVLSQNHDKSRLDRFGFVVASS